MKRGLIREDEVKPITSAEEMSKNYTELARVLFGVTNNLMGEYSGLLQRHGVKGLSPLAYEMDTYKTGMYLYAYSMIQIKNRLRRIFTTQAKFKEQESMMVAAFVNETMGSSDMLIDRMEMIEGNLEIWLVQMKSLGFDKYIEEVDKAIRSML